jgi:hypothetical protein
MKVTFSVSSRLTLELEATTQKELFAQLASWSEIFGTETCGSCESDNVKYQVRTVEENDYHEMVCNSCRAKLAFGVAKKGGGLFPKRKDKDGNWLKDNGWVKYEGATKAATKKPKNTKQTVDTEDQVF